MDPQVVAALVTAVLGGTGALVALYIKGRRERRTRWHAERYKAYTEFQQQCHDTFNQGKAVASAIVPPRPRDVHRLMADMDAYQANLDRCTELRFDIVTIGGSRVRKAVDGMGEMFNVQAGLVQAAVHLLGEPETEQDRLDVEAALRDLSSAWQRAEHAWHVSLERFAAAARDELDVR
jgi:hypothetical protein